METLVKQQEGKNGGGGNYRRNNILDSKAVRNLKMIGADKSGFRAWHERLVNIMEQIRPGSRGRFKALARHVDHEVTEEFAEWMEDQQEYEDLKNKEVLKEVSKDVYSLLMDKAESEALTRVRAYPAGDGLNAYRSVYKWFMGVSGQAIADKMRKLMAPTTPKAEHDLADHLDRWMESVRTLENLKPEYKLQDPFKLIALEQIMAVGQAKLYFESVKIAGGEFSEVFNKCKDYATRRRMEHGHRKGKDDMDVDNVVETPAYEEPTGVPWDMGGYDPWSYHDPWEVDYFNKGKGGKGGKGKGKGK